MTAHLDRARAADELQPRCRKHFGKFGDYVDRSRRRCDRHRYRDDVAGRRRIFVVYVRSTTIMIIIFVVMNGGTMLMVAVVRMAGNSMNVEAKRLGLERRE